MFSCHLTIGRFLDELMADMGLYSDRDRAFYRGRMNEALLFLYTAVIRMRAEGTATPLGGFLPCEEIPTPAGTAPVEPSDVLAVFCGNHQLRYLPPEHLHDADGLPCCFYTVTEDGILLSHTDTVMPLRVVFTVRPPAYGEDSEDTKLPMPGEFVPLLAAKVRGDVYLSVGEDELAAKWLASYNAKLADFYDYLAARRRR